MKIRKFPSKTFLLGEYAVLEKGHGLLLASSPFFTATTTENKSSLPFHKDSEAGRYWQEFESFFKNLAISIDDPHYGRGGFGASGAEFLSLFVAKENNNPWDALRAFKKFAKSSGADIVTQLVAPEGVSTLVAVDLQSETFELLPLPHSGDYFLTALHTGKKMPTRELQYPKLPLDELNSLTLHGISAFKKRDIPEFAKTLSNYGKLLESLGVLMPHCLNLVHSLAEFGALGSKGCGAGGSDVVVAITEKSIPLDWCKTKKSAKCLRHGYRSIYEKLARKCSLQYRAN